jgi:glycosyltransferase involved in cell wall biosynthesis
MRQMSEPAPVAARPAIDVVIPCLNEVAVLRHSVQQTLTLFDLHPEFDWHIVIADNGSDDGTGELAKDLQSEDPRVRALIIPMRGRGLALSKAWLDSTADVVAYMDVDLSTDIRHLPELVGKVARGECDVTIGTRLARGAQTRRSLKREITSRGYVALIRATFPRLKITDAQCGFKALSRKAADDLVPRVENRMWFFDTELLILAQRHGYRICEIPVRWIEDPDTKVKILKTAAEDIKGLARMRVSRR